jgi:hypothetical protein
VEKKNPYHSHHIPYKFSQFKVKMGEITRAELL